MPTIRITLCRAGQEATGPWCVRMLFEIVPLAPGLDAD